MSQETMSAADFRALQRGQGGGEAKTGPGNALSSPRPSAKPEADESPGEEYARRWRAGESVFLAWIYRGREEERRVLSADELQDLFSEAVRASSHRVIINLTEPDDHD